jgi:hypothetical protein
LAAAAPSNVVTSVHMGELRDSHTLTGSPIRPIEPANAPLVGIRGFLPLVARCSKVRRGLDRTRGDATSAADLVDNLNRSGRTEETHA